MISSSSGNSRKCNGLPHVQLSSSGPQPSFGAFVEQCTLFHSNVKNKRPQERQTQTDTDTNCKMFVLLLIMDPCQELWKQADIHHKYRSKKNCEPAQAAPADAKEAPIVKTTLCFSKMSWRRDKTKDWIPSPMSTHQVKNLKRMQLMSGDESCIRMAWSLMGRYKRTNDCRFQKKESKENCMRMTWSLMGTRGTNNCRFLKRIKRSSHKPLLRRKSPALPSAHSEPWLSLAA